MSIQTSQCLTQGSFMDLFKLPPRTPTTSTTGGTEAGQVLSLGIGGKTFGSGLRRTRQLMLIMPQLEKPLTYANPHAEYVLGPNDHLHWCFPLARNFNWRTRMWMKKRMKESFLEES